MKNPTLWSKNYILLTLASTFGSIGGIAGSYALSFLVFDKTGSTLATGLLTALQIVPHFLLPILLAPIMDRLPRKPFLVFGDLFGALMYAFAALYLHNFEFSYPMYLVFSLIINCVNALDSLAYTCFFPKTIPEGFEDKGYTISAMLYPVLNVIMMPLAALLMDTIGVANILFIQSGMSVLAAITENFIKVEEKVELSGEKTGFSLWLDDFKKGFAYLKGEKGLLNIYANDAYGNGMYMGCGPLQVAYFRTAPGLSAQLYAFFSAAEFIGRSLGGLYRYNSNMKPQKRRKFVYFVQQFYNAMDGVLLWLPYPLMLLNRSVCGFLGINSGTVRASSIQQYLPEEYRARVNAFSGAISCIAGSIGALLIGALGELVGYRIAMTMVAAGGMFVCWLTTGRNKKELDKIYLYNAENVSAE